MPTARRTSLALVAAMAIAVLAACSSDSSDDASSPDPAPTTAAPAAIEPARDFSAPGVAVIAHRGASAEAPEHTFSAYDLAVEQGADYLEHDLHLTTDGVLVVFHDPTLERTARGPEATCTGPIAERTAAELETCEVGSWFDETNPDLTGGPFAGEPIPTMAQVFDRYGSDVRYYIEIKSPEEQPGIEQALLDLIDEAAIEPMDGDLPPIVIQSFSPDALRRIHDLRPELPLVQLISAVTGPTLDPASLDDIATYAVGIGPPSAFVVGDVVAQANERCLDVHPYTVDDRGEMARLLDLGVGGIFSNEPATLREATADAAGPDLCPAPATADR